MTEKKWIARKELPTITLQKPKVGRWVRPSRLKWRDEFVLHRREQGVALGITDLEQRAVPKEEVIGTLEERIMYLALTKRNIEFDFQSSIQGGRLLLGGMVADFILLDRPVIIRVQGTKWHQGLLATARDEIQKAYLEAMGYIILDIWDWQIHNEELLEDWLRTNIDVGVPSRGGGVIVTGEMPMEWKADVDALSARVDHIEGSLYRGIMDPSIRIVGSSVQVATLSSISANLGTVTAGTLIGTTFKTSATVGEATVGAGVLINGTHFAAYNSTGDLQFEIVAATGVARTGVTAPYAELSDEGLLIVNNLSGSAGLHLKNDPTNTTTELREAEGGLAVTSDVTDQVKFEMYDTSYSPANLRLGFGASASAGAIRLYDTDGTATLLLRTVYSSGDSEVTGLAAGNLVLNSASAQVVVGNDLEPSVDDTYYLGDFQMGWKGVILRDQVTAKWYKVTVNSGVVTATEVTS
jgi:very-short-patch-repair endonuclease